MNNILALISVMAVPLLGVNKRLGRYCLAFLSFTVLVSSVQATNYREDSFEYFGTEIILFGSPFPQPFVGLRIQEKKKLVLLHGDVTIPVEYSDGESFLHDYDTANGVNTWDGEQLAETSVNVSNMVTVKIADFNGDGHKDQFLQDFTSTFVIIYGSDTTQPLKIETIEIANLSDARIELGDINGDGKSDILVTYESGTNANQYVHAVSYGSSEALSNPEWQHPNSPAYAVNNQAATKPSFGQIVPGGTAGSFRVNESGAATFSLPLFSPKGPAGMSMGLGLNYSSQAGNGPLGKGWSMSAGTVITRCPATAFQNTDTTKVQYCINGSRLIRLTGGSDVTRSYATDITDISHISATFTASTDQNPNGFVVLKKDGTKHDFIQIGETTWVTDKIWNPAKSAYLKYEYVDVGAGTYKNTPSALARVSMVAAASNTEVAVTEYSYETRPDVADIYMNGSLKKLDKRVDKISVKNGSETVRTYHLSYGRSVLSGFSTLSYLQECGMQGECYEPLKFDWTNRKVAQTTVVKSDLDRSGSQQILTGEFSPLKAYGTAGYSDLVIVNGNDFDLYYGKGDGTWLKDPDSNNSSHAGSFTPSDDRQRRFFAQDYDRDGYTDIVVLDAVYIGKTNYSGEICGVFNSSFCNHRYEYRITPYLKTDLTEYFANGYNSFVKGETIVLTRNLGFQINMSDETFYLNLIDVNGDALADVVTSTNLEAYFNRLGLAVFLQEKNESEVTFSTYSSLNYLPLMKTSDTTCTGGTDVYHLGSYVNGDTSKFTSNLNLVDVDNDGYVDYVFNAMRSCSLIPPTSSEGVHSSWFVSYSPLGVNAGKILDLQLSSDEPALLSDFNGDGFVDIHTDTQLKINQANGEFVSADPKLFVWSFAGLPGHEPGGLPIVIKPISAYIPMQLNADGLMDFALFDNENSSQPLMFGYNEAGKVNFYDMPDTPDRENTSDKLLSPINMDVNADGIPDVVTVSNEGRITTFLTATDSIPEAGSLSEPTISPYDAPDVIKTITSSNGLKTQIEYGVGSLDRSLYLADLDAQQANNEWALKAPVFDVTGAVHLVKRVTDGAPSSADADANATVSKRYSYVGGKLQAGGRGFLGFRKLIVVDETFNVKTVTEYAQQFPYQSMPLYTYKVATGDALDDTGISGFMSEDIYEPVANANTETGFSKLSNIDRYGYTTTENKTSCRDTIKAGSDENLIWLSCARNILNVKEFATATEQSKYNPVYPYIETAIEELFHTKTEFDGTAKFIPRGQDNSADILKSIVTTSEFGGVIDEFYGDLTKQVMTTNVRSGDFMISHNVVSDFKYDQNDASNWWLGRMTEQLVTTSYSSGNYTTAQVKTNVSTSSGSTSNPRSRSIPISDPVYVTGTSFTSLVDYDLSYLGSYLDDPRSSVERKTTFAYSPTTGVLKSSTVEPDNSELSVTTTYAYDSWGNKESVTKQSGVDGSSELYFWRKAETMYDANGVYPTHVYEYTSEGSKRLTSTVNSRNALGQPLSVTGQNGVSSSKEYDGFGRNTGSTSSLGAYSETTYGFCSADIYCPNASLGYLVVSKTSNAAPSQKTYSDKLGQTLRASTRSFDGNWTHVDNQYDKIGRALKTSNPFSGSEADYWTSYDYDMFGRAIRAVFPNNTTVATQYDGFYTTSTDHLGLNKSSLTNAIGDTVYIKEFTSDGSAETVLKEVFYRYDLQGNQTQVVGDGSTITTGYNLIGQAINTQDPVKGTWTYSRNALGELIHQTNANSEVTRNTYDDLGRIKTRTIKSGVTVLESTNWNYDGASNGLGKIDSISGQFSYAGIGTSYAYGFTYNTDAQLATKTTTIDGISYKEKWTYDSIGRSDVHYDASNGNTSTPTNGTKTHYNNYNYVSGLSDATGSHYYFTPLATDDFGNITQFQYGNGVISTANYDDVTGRLRNLSAGKNSNNDEILDYFYQYDAVGNLDYKQDANLGYTEDMRYDTTYRLTDVVSTGFFTDAQMGAVDDYNLSITYMAGSSRIATKSNYENGTTYTYGGAINCNAGQCDNHVLTSVGALEFKYDKNGNRLSEIRNSVQERSAQYTAYDKPWSITKDSNISQFAYGAGSERIKQISNTDGVAKTIRYVGGVEWIDENNDNTWTYKRRIAGYALEEQQADDTIKRSYLHKDYQGSVVAITNDTGVIQQRLSYDVYGARRNVLYNHATGYIKPGASFYDQIGVYTYNGELAAAVRQVALDSRGYTGHEHLDGVGLIHMNGRVFDPLSALFLSADPHIPDVSDQYSLNRFSYTRNRPVNFTDPSGYFDLNPVKAIQHLGRQADRFVDWAGREMDTETGKLVISIAITYFTAGYGYGWAMAGGFASGYVATGTLKGAVMGAIFAGASYGVGSLAGNISNTAVRETARATMHGFLGGIRSRMAGGSFSSGFKAAGLATIVSHAGGFAKAGITTKAGRIVAAAVIGGTVSEMSGGKFANGAISAAFAQAYNAENSFLNSRDDCPGECVLYTNPKDGSQMYVSEGVYPDLIIADAKGLSYAQELAVPTAVDGLKAVGYIADGITMVVPNPYTGSIGLMADGATAYLTGDATQLMPSIVGGGGKAILKTMGHSSNTAERTGTGMGVLFDAAQ